MYFPKIQLLRLRDLGLIFFNFSTLIPTSKTRSSYVQVWFGLVPWNILTNLTEYIDTLKIIICVLFYFIMWKKTLKSYNSMITAIGIARGILFITANRLWIVLMPLLVLTPAFFPRSICCHESLCCKPLDFEPAK